MVDLELDESRADRRLADIAILATALVDHFGTHAVALVERQVDSCGHKDARSTWLEILKKLRSG